jgi:hypothetical protein
VAELSQNQRDQLQSKRVFLFRGREVHDMFLEIAHLVTQQGELVDNIEQVVFGRQKYFFFLL